MFERTPRGTARAHPVRGLVFALLIGELLATLWALAAGFAASHHPTVQGKLGTPAPSDAMLRVIDEPGPIEIYFYVLRHPTYGTFIVDSGVESGFRAPDSSERVSGNTPDNVSVSRAGHSAVVLVALSLRTATLKLEGYES